MSTCNGCSKELTELNWYTDRRNKCQYDCKRCLSIKASKYHKEYYKRKKEASRAIKEANALSTVSTIRTKLYIGDNGRKAYCGTISLNRF